jgi:hypothetical protein
MHTIELALTYSFTLVAQAVPKFAQGYNDMPALAHITLSLPKFAQEYTYGSALAGTFLFQTKKPAIQCRLSKTKL